ncbi:MAG: glycerophosphodiester phosphodiesterase [Planctomycetota bacterium]|jgi:glycerophosphoryl diester phosphodiesterase
MRLWPGAVLLLAACRTPLPELPPLAALAPSVVTGYYTVHAVENGRVSAEPGAEPFGTVLYLYEDLYVQRGRFFRGLRGAFLPAGGIFARLEGDDVRHVWRERESEKVGSFDFLGSYPPRLRVADRALVLRRTAPPPVPTIFLAHRGACYAPPLNHDGIYPSNTIPAFEAALRAGYRGFELDVRVTKDRRFVVAHDEDLGVSTDREGRVGEKTLAELRGTTVLLSPRLPETKASSSHAYVAAPMPDLREVFDRFLKDPRVARIVVDVKPDTDERLLAAARHALTGRTGIDHEKLIFLSRSQAFISGLKPQAPRATYALEGSLGIEPLKEPEKFLPESVGRPRAAHDAISVSVRLMLAFFRTDVGLDEFEQLLAQAHRHGYAVVGWTISDEGRMELLRRRALWPDYALSDAPYARLALQRLKTSR